MNIIEMNRLLDAVVYKDWDLLVDGTDERPYLQVRWMGLCTRTGSRCEQSGRKWFLSQYMTKSELVQTALKAVLTAVEHEAREAFLYRGRAIFGPHFDVDHLVEVREKPQDVRA